MAFNETYVLHRSNIWGIIGDWLPGITVLHWWTTSLKISQSQCISFPFRLISISRSNWPRGEEYGVHFCALFGFFETSHSSQLYIVSYIVQLFHSLNITSVYEYSILFVMMDIHSILYMYKAIQSNFILVYNFIKYLLLRIQVFDVIINPGKGYLL